MNKARVAEAVRGTITYNNCRLPLRGNGSSNSKTRYFYLFREAYFNIFMKYIEINRNI